MLTLKAFRSNGRGNIRALGTGIPKSEREIKVSLPLDVKVAKKEYDQTKNELLIRLSFGKGGQTIQFLVRFSERQPLIWIVR